MSASDTNREEIRLVGAHENNLKNVSLSIPKRKLTVFTGVSGSGKSSLVFDTIAAESRRLIDETYSGFIQGFMPSRSRPQVDHMEGLTAAIIVDQEPLGSNPRSTVGTACDAYTLLRILFSRCSTPQIGSPQAFAFNVASISGAGAVTVNRGGEEVKERREFSVTGGMCQRCQGQGRVSDFDLAAIYDEDKSLNEGALLVPNYKVDTWYGRIFRGCGFFDPDKPIKEFTKRELNALLYKEPTRIKVEGVNVTFEGVISRVRKTMLQKDREAMQPHIRAFVDRAITFGVCPECDGSRLNEAARTATVAGRTIAELCEMELSELAAWIADLEEPTVAPLVAALRQLLASFVEIGLGYLSLNRPAGSLSGGEAQRLRLVRHLSSSLTDVTYVFDEPSIGLHPHDIDRMNTLLLRLRDKGNTVLVIEHRPEVIAVADHVVDLGPGAGPDGGEVTFTGTLEELRHSDTLTGRHLGDRARLKPAARGATGRIEIRGASAHNLKSVDVDIPLGVLVAITGVAGSGKSSLTDSQLAKREGVVYIDQSAIKGSRRSNPASFTGALDPIRKAFAKANGVKPGLFSFNSDGACPVCKGAGVIYTDLGYLETFSTPCEQCQGKRFNAEVLQLRFGSATIADVLDMTIAEAAAFFSASQTKVTKAAKILSLLVKAGIGYLTLGQELTSLSGGERQRVKLAKHIGEDGQVFVLDEPTTGLHLADIASLLALLDTLVDAGRTVIVIEHHQSVVAHADWVIDLGPGAGQSGGEVVFSGTPAELAGRGDTLTGKYLARYLS